MYCTTDRRVLDCGLGDGLGGFQMDATFARIASYDDAPAGWPWDGKVHTAKEMDPGV